MKLTQSLGLFFLVSSLAASARESIENKRTTALRQGDDDFEVMEDDTDDFLKTEDDDYRRFKTEDGDDDFQRLSLKMEDDNDFRRMEDDDDFRRMEDNDYLQNTLRREGNYDYRGAESDDDYRNSVRLEDDDYRMENNDDDFKRREQDNSLLRELASLQSEVHTKPPQQLQHENRQAEDYSTPPAPDQRKKVTFEENTDIDALVQKIMSEQSDDDGDDDVAMNQLVMVSAEGYEYEPTHEETKEIFQDTEGHFKFSESSDAAYSASDGMTRVEDFINASSQRVFGRDTRIRIRNTFYYPWTAYGKVDVGCTGTFIGPRHVLTAGHCVYNPYIGKWNRNLNVRRCKNCNPNTGIIYRWKTAVTVRGWIHGRRAYDYAVIVVNRPSSSWMAFGYRIPMPKYYIHMAGYPGDKRGQCMWYSYCRLLSVYTRLMTHRCDTYYGMSGAGVYVKFGRWRIVYGVHVGAAYRRNVAIRINKIRFRTLLYIRRRFR